MGEEICTNIFPLTAKAAAQKQNKSKTRRLLGAFWHRFLNKFPKLLIRKLKKNAPFQSLFARRGLLAVSGHYRLIMSAHEWTLLDHVSRFHQSCARRNIWWIINYRIMIVSRVLTYTLQVLKAGFGWGWGSQEWRKPSRRPIWNFFWQSVLCHIFFFDK